MELKETGTYFKSELYAHYKDKGFQPSYNIFIREFLYFLDYNRTQTERFNQRRWVYPSEFRLFDERFQEYLEPEGSGKELGASSKESEGSSRKVAKKPHE